MEYQIITDSASDLPWEIRDNYPIFVIPTPVVLNDKVYLDGRTLTTDEFYRQLDNFDNDIKTFHINPHMFEEAFEPYAKNGTKIIYICFSTGIAATFNAANIARESILEKYPDFEAVIIDSKCASAGFGLLVYKLLQMQKQGASSAQVVEAASFYSLHIKHIFTVETLAFLIKGGRLGKTKGLLAQKLNIKPIITLDKVGSLKVLKLSRGRKASLKGLVTFMKEHAVELEEQTIMLCHGEDPHALKILNDMVEKEGNPRRIMSSVVGCAIGAHTGRGVVAIAFLDASDKKFKEYLD